MAGIAPSASIPLASGSGDLTSVTDTGCNFLLEDGSLLAQEDGSSGFLGENCFQSTTSVTDTGCNLLLEDGGLFALEDGTSGILGENCFLSGTSVTDTGCNFLLEDGGLFALEDGTSGLLGENCFQGEAVVPTFITAGPLCRLVQEDGGLLVLEDGSGDLILEQCFAGGWVGKPRRPAKRWWELIREEREAIRNAERLKDEPLQEAVDDVVEIVEEQRGLTGQRLLDATEALKQAAAAKTRQEAAAATLQLEAVVRAVRLYLAEMEDEDEAMLLLLL